MCMACYCSGQLLCLEMERRLHPLSLSKGYPDKKGREDEGGSSGREVIRRTEKISFPALYGENSISWENLAERWEIYPPNIDNHLFISWQQQGRKKKMHESPLKWSRLSFPSLSRLFLFCGGRESISSPTCSSGPNHRISYYWRGSVCCIGCIAERRKRRGPRSNSPTFVSLSFSPPGRICILMEGFYRLLGGVRGTTSGIIKWTKPD